MGIIVNGTWAPIRQQVSVSYDPQHGQVITVPWACAGNGLAGLARFYQRNRVAFDWKPNDRMSTLVARVAGGQLGIPDVSVDEWQLVANEQQLSLLYLNRLSDNERDVIEEALDSNTAVDDVLLPPGGYAIEIYKKLKLGIANFAFGQQVLMHTVNASENYDKNIADVNVESIYSTEKMIGECQSLDLWVFPMPTAIAGAINAADEKFRNMFPERTGYQIGWRKLPSTRTTASGNRIAIKTEFWFGQWDTLIYTDVVK